MTSIMWGQGDAICSGVINRADDGGSLLLSSSVTAQSTTDNQRIEAIEIKGNKRVAAGTVVVLHVVACR